MTDEEKVEGALMGICFGLGSMITPAVVSATTDITVPGAAVALMVGAGAVTAIVSNGLAHKALDGDRKQPPKL